MSAPPDDLSKGGTPGEPSSIPASAAAELVVAEVTTEVSTQIATIVPLETPDTNPTVALLERVSIEELAEPVAAEPETVASLLAEGGDQAEPDPVDPVAEAAAAEAARGRTLFHPRPSVLPDPAHRLVVVEASAGTGKTYFLEHRVVDLILQAGAELPQILIVTFTEKATTELRRRIHDLVDRMSRVTSSPPTAASSDADGESGADPAPLDPASIWRIDPAARARLRAAAHAFSQSAIFTIHGFCHRVLLEDAFAANRLFEQVQVADEIAFRSAFYDVLRDTLAVVPEHAELLEVYLRSSSVDKLEQLLLSSMRAQAMPRSRTGAVTMRRMLTELGVLADEPSRASLLADLGLSKPNHHHRRWLDEITYAVAQARQLLRVAEMIIALAPAREAAGKLL